MKRPRFNLFDSYPPLPEDKEPVCPRCGSKMMFRKQNFAELSYECSLCRTQVYVTSRNNQRMWKVLQLVLIAVALGFAVGLLFSRFLLWQSPSRTRIFLSLFWASF